jgi:hypothetical protein
MRQALKAALVALTIIASVREASSATITVHERDGVGRVFVDVVGTINDEDFKAFKEKTDRIYQVGPGLPIKQVIVTLVSYGGSILPALQIGDWIRKRGMSTFVPGDRTCASACALIWVAGRPRTVGDTPQIGFHAAYDEDSGRETGASNAVVGAYLRDLGVGYKAIVFMTRKGPTSLEWLTPNLAKDLGIAWAMLQPPRAILIPPQPNLQPRLQPPPQIMAAWSKSARSLAPQQLPTSPASPKPMPVEPPVTTLPEPVPQQATRPKITDRIGPQVCTNFRVTPPEPEDRDPIVSARLDFEDTFAVTHVTLSGRTYSRGEQYRDVRVWTGRDGVTHWAGTWRRDPAVRMVGSFTADGEYTERLFRRGQLETTTVSNCTLASSANAQPPVLTDDVAAQGPAELDVRIVPGTKWSISVTKKGGEYVSCQITAFTNDAELRLVIGSKGSLVMLLQDQYQENAIRDTLGWRDNQSFRAALFIDKQSPIAAQAERIWEHTLLIPLSNIDSNVIFAAKRIAIAIGGISMRGYDVAGLSTAKTPLYECYRIHGRS